MTYNEALEYIHSVEWLGSRPGLSRTQELLSRLGNPEKGMRFIHVAGTNGKGSTCAMLSSVLQCAGFKTGLYTSPYIVRFNERMCIDGDPISDSELAELVETIKPVADSMADKPTEFEMITALAFLYYKRHSCDVVVLEAGMGGRLDSTNVIEAPLVSVITGVAIDHTSVLGNTVAEIAKEKAGIIKPGCPVVYGGRDNEAFEVIKKKAEECCSDLRRTRLDTLNVHKMNIYGSEFDYSHYLNVEIPLCGAYQPENTATVLETVRMLVKHHGFYINSRQIREGLKNARWRARFELLADEPPVIFDGSHNIQGVAAAVESIKHFFGEQKVALLMGVLADKDYYEMAELLSPYAESVFTVTPDSPRALKSSRLAEVFGEHGIPSKPFSDVEHGVAEAYEYAKAKNIPLVMLGSLYMYGEVFDAFDKAKKK